MTVQLQQRNSAPSERKPCMSGIFEVQHPLISNHLARLRDVSTPPPEFRVLVQRLAVLLAYEATKDWNLLRRRVETPLAVTTGQVLNQRIGLIPILRAGLGMVDPVLNLIPGAEVWHLGVYRDEATGHAGGILQPVSWHEPCRCGAGLGPDVGHGRFCGCGAGDA